MKNRTVSWILLLSWHAFLYLAQGVSPVSQVLTLSPISVAQSNVYRTNKQAPACILSVPRITGPANQGLHALIPKSERSPAKPTGQRPSDACHPVSRNKNVRQPLLLLTANLLLSISLSVSLFHKKLLSIFYVHHFRQEAFRLCLKK